MDRDKRLGFRTFFYFLCAIGWGFKIYEISHAVFIGKGYARLSFNTFGEMYLEYVFIIGLLLFIIVFGYYDLNKSWDE